MEIFYQQVIFQEIQEPNFLSSYLNKNSFIKNFF